MSNSNKNGEGFSRGFTLFNIFIQEFRKILRDVDFRNPVVVRAKVMVRMRVRVRIGVRDMIKVRVMVGVRIRVRVKVMIWVRVRVRVIARVRIRVRVGVRIKVRGENKAWPVSKRVASACTRALASKGICWEENKG